MGYFVRAPVQSVAKWKSWLALALAVATLVLLFIHGGLRDQVEKVYEPAAPRDILTQSKIRFEEVAQKLGVVNFNRMYYPARFVRQYERDLTLATLHPSVSVVDLNDDGYMDIYISTSNQDPNPVFINQKGRGFVRRDEDYGISDVNQKYVSAPPVFADFNGDGFIDVLVSKYGCHQYFVGQGPGKPFLNRSRLLHGFCSNPQAVNVLDYNHDGRLDLIFGNYYDDVDLRYQRTGQFMWGTRNDKTHGGRNNLLINTQFGFRRSGVDFFYKSFTNTVGVLDINGDGWPDLFFGNDYSTDEMWMNLEGKDFQEVTERYIPTRYHGYAGMNSEVMDFNQDGLSDLYVTNIYKPPYANNRNVLWQNTGHGYQSVAGDLGVAKCGFSWGAKFADFDLDGDLDLMVVNGRAHGEHVRSPAEGRSYWHERTVIGQTPLFMRDFFARHRSQGSDEIYVSAFEHSCLFEQKNGHFYDVAEHAGITDLDDGKGLALIDYDNDGKMDFVVVNSGGPTLLYHNISQTDGDWIGFSLRNKQGSPIPVGAIAKLYIDGKEQPLVRELYPNNGYHSQSDPRLLYGLGHMKPTRLEVQWPMGKKEVYENLQLNAYQGIREGQGRLL